MIVNGKMINGASRANTYGSMPKFTQLSKSQNDDIATMLGQLQTFEERNHARYVFYNAEQEFQNMGVAIPEEFEQYASVLGWNRTAVDTLARRIRLDGFVAPGSPDRYTAMDGELKRVQFYRQLKMVIQSTLIYGVSFMAVIPGMRGAQVHGFSARNATGIWDDSRPYELRAGLAILDWGPTYIKRALAFFPGEVVLISRAANFAEWSVEKSRTFSNELGLIPYMFLPQLDKPWGQSRINRPMMGYTQAAARAFLRAEMNAEVYGYPQLFATNLDPEIAAAFRSGFARFFAVDYERDEDGQPMDGAPETKIGQVQVGQQTPHLEQMRSIAMLYAAETQLSPDKMGVIHDNPSSADAIDRADGELNDLAEDTTRDLDHSVGRTIQTIWSETNREATAPAEIQALNGDWADPGLTTRYSQRMALSSLTTAGLVVPGVEVSYEAAGFSRGTAQRLAAAWQEKERRDAMRAVSEQALTARTSAVTRDILARQDEG